MIVTEYGIKAKPASSRNLQANVIIEQNYQVLGDIVWTYNLQETYVDDSEPWMVILAETDFTVRSTYHRIKENIPGQLVFVQDNILPIKHIADCRYICQCKQAPIEKDVICKALIEMSMIIKLEISSF